MPQFIKQSWGKMMQWEMLWSLCMMGQGMWKAYFGKRCTASWASEQVAQWFVQSSSQMGFHLQKQEGQSLKSSPEHARLMKLNKGWANWKLYCYCCYCLEMIIVKTDLRHSVLNKKDFYKWNCMWTHINGEQLYSIALAPKFSIPI